MSEDRYLVTTDLPEIGVKVRTVSKGELRGEVAPDIASLVEHPRFVWVKVIWEDFTCEVEKL